MLTLLNTGAILAAVVSSIGFGIAVRDASGCHKVHVDNIASGARHCYPSTCVAACNADFIIFSGGAYFWCECGGSQDGAVSNEYCHAMVKYRQMAFNFFFESYECVLECPTPTQSCTPLIANPTFADEGKQLCDCR